VSTSLVKILQKAGISFAILGTEEKCTGDFARRVGNEMLYQMMAEENIETLNGYRVKKIITACPHCLNTLKHEYPQKGGNYEVIHHSDFIDQLVKTARSS
jgi:Fe-S oxidoreductase